MFYVVTALIVLMGLASSAIIETAAEISANTLLDGDAGVEVSATTITAGGVVDIRPEASLIRHTAAGD